ncbi:MAG: sugar transferase [Thermoleophilia bacterium]
MAVPLLVVWDALCALVLFAATVPLAGGSFFQERAVADGVGVVGGPSMLFAAVALGAVALVGGYERRPRTIGLGRLGRLLMAGALTGWVVWTASAALDWDVDLGQLLAVALLAPPAWAVGRHFRESRVRRNPERVLVIGSGHVARHVAELTARHPERGLKVIGCVDDQALRADGDPPLLGRIDDLRAVLQEHEISRVIVGFSLNSDAEILSVLRECDTRGVDVDIVPRLFDLVGPEPVVDSLGGMGLVSVERQRLGGVQAAAKRAVDIAVSAALLVFTAPLMAVIAAAIRLSDGGPALFRQTRIGKAGEEFQIVKFRTMVPGADRQQASTLVEQGPEAIAQVAESMKHQSDAWITPLGRFLRQTSLDELPQLWNVLRGDMSLVGPRPLRRYEVDALSNWESMRQAVRPGITGLWQILGRSDILWHERMQLDYTYVRHWSLRKDIAILARTAGVVLGRRGAV